MIMTMRRICSDNQTDLTEKGIYFAGFSAANIGYFMECFPQYSANICGVYAVLDIDERTPKTAKVGEKTFDIKDLRDVSSLNSSSDVLVIMYEYENEAFEKIRDIRGDDPISVFWFPDRATEIELGYRERFSNSEPEDIILFRSGPRQFVYGDDFADNSKALFEYMVSTGYNEKWTLVWLVYDPDNSDYDEWKHHKNVIFIGIGDKDSKEENKRYIYYRYLSLAKFAFVTDDETFFRRRRSDQIMVQLWHGDGIKARTRFRRMEKRFEYMVCTSGFFADVNCVDFGLRPDQMIATGLPKDDWVVAGTDNSVFLTYIEGFSHYILWGPTFRKSVKGLEILNENIEINETGLPLLNSWEDCEKLNEKLREKDCLLVIKLHPVADLSLYEKMDYSNIRLMTNQDLYTMGLHINQIMACFEAFITDYSSASTSYTILDRPMAFTLDDVDEYENSRGFVLTPVRDYLPGAELYSLNDMNKFVADICAGVDASAPKRRLLIAKTMEYMNGGNCARLLDTLRIDK